MAPITFVAVVGAGISGVASAAHLLRKGLEVVVFERSDVAGGVWHFDPRADKDPEYPVVDIRPGSPSSGAGIDTKPETNGVNGKSEDDILLAHAPPGPCYEGLMNNVPTRMMRSMLMQWPAGTPDHVTHKEIETYVQDLARETGAHDATLYNTRVEEAVKNPETGRWSLRTKTLHKNEHGKISFEDRNWTFDAVVAAAGHYHVPLVPHVPGLAEWKQKFQNRVMHSKSYRYPAAFKGQNVFLVGAGVSSLDISKELEGIANKTYQSSRGGKFDLDSSLLPANSERVAGLKAFKLDEGKTFEGDTDAPIPGTIHLTDGRILSDIHQVIVASGYQMTYPFLKGLESETIPYEEADENIIITADKCVTHNLHHDIFYIPDPTLSFVGVPYYTSTFSMFDFQAEVVARVYAGLSNLPSEDAMKAQYAARKANGAKGKEFHSLIQNQVPYMEEILKWANEGVEERGVERMQGVDKKWFEAYEEFKEASRRLIPQGSKQIQQPVASKYYAAGLPESDK